MVNENDMVLRYTPSQRSNHWVVAILFMLAAFSGLALFHPSLFWLTNLFGGGAWTRILHPFFGAIMFVFFLILALRFVGHNFLHSYDFKWLAHIKDVIVGNEDKIPPVGRYNAGQKILFWVMVWCMLLLLVTGIMIWRPWFDGYFAIELKRLAVLIHALSAWILIAGIMVHIYAAFWVKGTMGGMLSGWVSRYWAKAHHPLWHDEISKEKQNP